jgi:imidazolonepropionase-like amidohydrolase
VPDAVVVVDGDRIVAAGSRSRVAVPTGAVSVDATGKTIVPGLWDMHAHFEQIEWGPLYLAAGVTTARDCGNELDFIRAIRDAIDRGQGLGPRLLLACLVDGEGPGSLGRVRLRSADEIPKLVRKFQDAGCRQVKIYQSFDPHLIAPLVRAAHEAGMTVTGHVPTGIEPVEAVEQGMDQINHLSFIMRALVVACNPQLENADARDPRWIPAYDSLDLDAPASRKTIAFFASRHTVIDPTLALRELFSRPTADLVRDEPGLTKLPPALRAAYSDVGPPADDVARSGAQFKKYLRLLGRLHQAGVVIVAGTDQAIPGHSIHREMELYVQAGFTPYEAIQAATIVPARVMKLDREVGTVEAGKRADFILVDGDPLADIRALRRIALVVAAGQQYEPAALWRSVQFEP